jgi:DNA-binding CsgD family transcriptional regulator
MSQITPQAYRPSAIVQVTATPGRLQERLQAERARCFIARREELERFARSLANDSTSVLFVSGQLGVGKSTLLRAFQRHAQGRGHAAELVECGPTQAGGIEQRSMRKKLSRVRSCRVVGGARRVVLVDGVEARADQIWLLTELLPSLGDVLLVVGSRSRPPLELTLDPGWAGLMEHLELLPLSPDEARALLRQRAVPEAVHQALLELSGRYPLSLVLAAEHVGGIEVADASLRLLQDVQQALGRLLQPRALTSGQRLALDLCSVVRSTTAELLEHVSRTLGPDVTADGFDWLAEQSFVTWTARGVEPHHQMRLALSAFLRREHPRRYRALCRAAREFFTSEIEHGDRPDLAVRDLAYVDREVSVVRPLTSESAPPPSGGVLRPAAPEDHEAIVQLVGAVEGPTAAVRAQRNLRRSGENFEVLHGAGVQGVLTYLRLSAESLIEGLQEDEPLARTVRRFLLEHPLASSEAVLVFRWCFEREQYQSPAAPGMISIIARQAQLVLNDSAVSFSFAVFRDVEVWSGLWKNNGLPWWVLSTFSQDGRDYSVVCFAWKRRGLRDAMVNQRASAERVIGAERVESVDELQTKVRERVARLAKQVTLTPREREILEQLCLGASLGDISRQLAIRPRTVKFHQENLLRKTGTSSRVELFRRLM